MWWQVCTKQREFALLWKRSLLLLLTWSYFIISQMSNEIYLVLQVQSGCWGGGMGACLSWWGQLYHSATKRLFVFCVRRQQQWDCMNQELCGLLADCCCYCFCYTDAHSPRTEPRPCSSTGLNSLQAIVLHLCSPTSWWLIIKIISFIYMLRIAAHNYP